MDILIKNMEMPNTCRRCMEMGIPVHCRVREQEAVTAVMSGYDRPSDCPLVALPEHGRLIDATELEASDAILIGEDAWNMVHNAPTVLEANNGTDS